MGNYLHIEDLNKMFDTRKVLDSVTLDIESGRVLTLVGVNGSGKTTLLRILAGLDFQSSGIIRINDRITDVEELRQLSTLVFQKTTMFNTSIYNNVAFGLKVRDFNRQEVDRRVSQALSMVGLRDFQKRNAKRISGGEQQRVALARAFVLHPDILLLDEPTANLDPANAMIIENIIKKIRRREDCIIILATHNLHQAKRLSDVIVHIHHGKVLEYANPSDFFSRPSNQITKKFVDGELQF